MNKNKIDERLLKQVACLSTDAIAECLVYYDDRKKLEKLLSLSGAEKMYDYSFINVLHCKLKRENLYKIAEDSSVKYISSISFACCQMDISKRILKSKNVKLSGQDVGVAFIDTGVGAHCDFLIGENRIKTFKDFIQSKKNFYDDNGHGTFVAGVCAGNGVLSKFKYSGIAPKANLHILKALNKDGEATANKILDAMEWVYDNHIKEGIKVVCMSFGSEPVGINDPIMQGANALWRDGVVVIAAAGNSGPNFGTIKSPGISAEIITVGGFDDNRFDRNSYNKNFFEMANFSSRGPVFSYTKPDLIAPSVEIKSCGTDTFYTRLSGTSVATPMIAGVVCLMLEKNQNLLPKQIKQKLLMGCMSLGFDLNSEGYGFPDVEKILSSI